MQIRHPRLFVNVTLCLKLCIWCMFFSSVQSKKALSPSKKVLEIGPFCFGPKMYTLSLYMNHTLSVFTFSRNLNTFVIHYLVLCLGNLAFSQTFLFLHPYPVSGTSARNSLNLGGVWLPVRRLHFLGHPLVP